jgi:hypothetical protein
MDARAAQAGGIGPMVATPFDDFRRSKNSPYRFQPVDQAERQQFNQHAQDVQRLREERQKQELNVVGTPADTHPKEFVPTKAKLPGSPIVSRPGAVVDKDNAPPKIYEAPKPDRNVAAKPRVNRSLDQPQERKVNKVPLEQPKMQPKAPQPPPKVERTTPPTPPKHPQPQPKVERSKEPANPPPAESKQDKPKDQPKGKDKK